MSPTEQQKQKAYESNINKAVMSKLDREPHLRQPSGYFYPLSPQYD